MRTTLLALLLTPALALGCAKDSGKQSDRESGPRCRWRSNAATREPSTLSGDQRPSSGLACWTPRRFDRSGIFPATVARSCLC